MVNTEFAAENEDIMKAFLAAVAASWKGAINDLASAVWSLVKRNPAADAALKERRLILAVNANVLTDYVKSNGMGGIDSALLDAVIAQIAQTYEYKGQPDTSQYFTDKYLAAGGFDCN